MLADPLALDVAAVRHDPDRRAIAEVARRAAFVAFCVSVVISPFRAAVLLAAQPRPPLYAGYTDFSMSWAEIAAAVALVLWAISLVAERRPISAGPRVLWVPALALVALGWLSAIWSVDAPLSIENAGELTLLAAFGLYVINEVRIERVPLLVAGTVAVQAIVALAQVALQGSLGLSSLGELPLDPALRGVSVVATSDTDRLLRAYGLTDHPNILGGILAFSLPLLAVGVLRAAQGARISAATIALGLTFVLGSAALFVTFSRGAWLAAAAAMLLALVLVVRSRSAGGLAVLRDLRWVGLAVAAAGLVVIALAIADARFVLVRADVLNPQVSTEAMSTGERAILMRVALDAITAQPLLGTGLATSAMAVLTAMPSLDFDAQPAAVAILDVAVELGLIGAACYLALIAAPWLTLARRAIPWTPWLIATSAALLGWAIVGLFDYYTWSFPAGQIWTALLFAFWAIAVRDARAGQGGPARSAAHG